MSTTIGTANQALKNHFFLSKLKWSVKDTSAYLTTKGSTGCVSHPQSIYGFISNWNNQTRLDGFVSDNL